MGLAARESGEAVLKAAEDLQQHSMAATTALASQSVRVHQRALDAQFRATLALLSI